MMADELAIADGHELVRKLVLKGDPMLLPESLATPSILKRCTGAVVVTLIGNRHARLLWRTTGVNRSTLTDA
jgi:hypothetical protein